MKHINIEIDDNIFIALISLFLYFISISSFNPNNATSDIVIANGISPKRIDVIRTIRTIAPPRILFFIFPP